jgi:hypothetical protein
VTAEVELGEVDYVFYGSPTGEGGYEVLAHSSGLSSGERESIASFSNLGGAVLLEKDPESIYAFYELAPDEKWAFTRVALRRGQRGNDYRALTLVLGRRIMKAARWNPFSLEAAGRALFKELEGRQNWQAHLPAPARRVRLSHLEEFSRQPLVVREGVDLDQLAAVLRRLATGTVAMTVDGKEGGIAICQGVLAALPPDDRRKVSFCTRFSFRRGPAFQLALYAPADEEQVNRYLRSAEAAARGRWGSLPVQKDPFRSWCELLAIGLDPLRGLELLKEPLETVRLVHFLQRRIKEGAEPPGMSLEVKEKIRNIILLEGNETLASVRHWRVHEAARELRNRLQAALSRSSSFLAEIAALSEWLLVVTAEEPPLAVLRDYFLHRSAKADADRLDRTICVLLLVSGVELQPERVFGLPEKSVFHAAGELARWIEDLAADSFQACLDLLATWLSAWRVKDFSRCAAAGLEISQALAAQARELPEARGLPLFLAAFEQAAPQEPETEDRAFWLLELYRRIGPSAGEAFQPLYASRIAAQGKLIALLTDSELASLAEPLVERFPAQMIRQLDWKSTPTGEALPALLAYCEERLLPGDLAPWGPETSPDHWELASFIALRSAQASAAAAEEWEKLWGRLAWLLLHAARSELVSSAGGAVEPSRRFTEALCIGLEQRPPGVMHILVDALFHRSQTKPPKGAELRCPCPQDVWLAVLRDIKCAPRAVTFYLMSVLDKLERDGLFGR